MPAFGWLVAEVGRDGVPLHVLALTDLPQPIEGLVGVAADAARQDAQWSTSDAAFGQQLLDIAIGQPVAQAPAPRDRDHLAWEAEPEDADEGRLD
jgi:hypothetical protein